MRIGELAARTGVSVRSLRYYEQQDILASTRTTGGQREYQETAVERVQLIQALFAAGLGSREVAEILPCAYSGTTTPAMVERLHSERERLDAQLAELTATRAELDRVIEEAVRRLVA